MMMSSGAFAWNPAIRVISLDPNIDLPSSSCINFKEIALDCVFKVCTFSFFARLYLEHSNVLNCKRQPSNQGKVESDKSRTWDSCETLHHHQLRTSEGESA